MRIGQRCMSRSAILGIDPGQNTGIAILRGGALVELRTVSPADVEAVIALDRQQLVVFEDSRKNTFFPRSKCTSQRVELHIARRVGEIDQLCREIERVCVLFGIPCIGVSPQRKGAKLNAERFAEITGWTKRCNQHERDAAMVAWQYRRLK